MVIPRMQWVEYDEPELLALTRSSRFVSVARIALLLWSVGVVIAAIQLRSPGDAADAGAIPVVARTGAVVIAMTIFAGWYWTDRVTQDVHLLSGRVPSRLRCVTAWLSPVAWTALLTVTVLGREPTEEFDFRPLIVVPIFVIAMWRPFALIRRILKSLIRVDSDVLIAAAYVLDLGAFGVLWWRLGTFPDEVTPTNEGSVGVLIGLGSVAAVALALSVIVWELLRRDVDRAVWHRSVAMRTRHDHAQLRAHGIDPMDEAVRRAMLQVGREEVEGERLELEQVAARLEPVLPDVDPHDRWREASATVTPTHSPLPRSVPDPPVDQAEESSHPEAESAAPTKRAPVDVPLAGHDDVGAHDDRDAVDAAESGSADATAEELMVNVRVADPGSADQVGPARVADDQIADSVATDAEAVDAEKNASNEPELVPDESGEVEQSANEGSVDGGDIHERLAQAVGRSTAERSEDEARSESLLDRLATRARSLQSDSADADVRDRLMSRFDDDTSTRLSGQSLLDRLEGFGISSTQPLTSEPGSTGSSGGMSNEPDQDGGHSDAALVRRVYSLEFARYIMLLALMVSIAGSIWFLMRSVDVGELVGGDISPQAVDRLEVARRVAVTSIACALATVPFWAAVVCRSANDIGVDVPGGRRSTALFGGAALVAFGVGFSDRELGGSAGLLGTILCLAAALWSLTVVKSVRSAMGRPASATSLLSIMLVLVVVLSWLGGLHDEVTMTNSVEALTFVGGLQVALLAVVTIVAAVGSGDVVKSVMLTRGTTFEPRRGLVEEPE